MAVCVCVWRGGNRPSEFGISKCIRLNQKLNIFVYFVIFLLVFNWLIDSNGMSTRLGVFYAQIWKLSTYLHFSVVVSSGFFFTQFYRIRISFKRIYLAHRWNPNKYLKPGSKAMKGYPKLPISPELKPHDQLQFSVIPRIPHFLRGGRVLTFLQGIQSVYWNHLQHSNFWLWRVGLKHVCNESKTVIICLIFPARFPHLQKRGGYNSRKINRCENESSVKHVKKIFTVCCLEW